MHNIAELVGAERIEGVHPGKQPAAIQHLALGTGRSPPGTQAIEQDGREHRKAILVAFALFDTQHTALAIDVADFQ